MEGRVNTPCRACGHASLDLILSLGRTPLANALLTNDRVDQAEPTFPLEVAFCPECTLLQLTHTVPPEELFRDYLYFSSFSDTMLRHAERLANRLIDERRLSPKSLVIEVASNDGYLLQYYKAAGVPVLGIEPAENIAKIAVERKHIPTWTAFFGAPLGQRLRTEGRRADVLHANNVLAHVPDLNSFVAGLRLAIKDQGWIVIEAPYAKDMIDHGEFDTIYHEHVFYFTLTALDRLFRRHDLLIHDVERLPIHGGSLRLLATPWSLNPTVQPSSKVKRLLDEEARWGVADVSFYRQFGQRVEALKGSLRHLLADLKQSGKRIAAYGAAAKGSTLLNYMGIGKETLDFVVDRSIYKQGRLMPGVRVPIMAPEQLLEKQPDFVLLLTWNFADEIIQQQTEYRRRGGRFIVPIPHLRVA